MLRLNHVSPVTNAPPAAGGVWTSTPLLAKKAAPTRRRGYVSIKAFLCAVIILVLLALSAQIWGLPRRRFGLPFWHVSSRSLNPTHVAVVVPLLSDAICKDHLVAVLDGNRVPMTVFYVVRDKNRATAAQSRIAKLLSVLPHSVREALVTRPPQVLAAEDVSNTYGGMVSAAHAALSTQTQYTHVLWIPQTRRPLASGFADALLKHLSEDVAMVTCTTLMPSKIETLPDFTRESRERLIVLDQGYWVADGEFEGKNSLFLARRLSGLPVTHESVARNAVVDAGSAQCTLISLDRALQVGIQPAFGEDTLFGDTLERELRRFHVRIALMNDVLSSITIADVTKGGDPMRKKVREAFLVMKQSNSLWEQLSGKLHSSQLEVNMEPQLLAERKKHEAAVAGSSIEVKLRFFISLLKESEANIHRPLGVDSADGLAWDLSFKFSNEGLRTIATSVTAILDLSVLPEDHRTAILNSTATFRTSYPIYGQFSQQWSGLAKRLYKGMDDHQEPLKVIWHGFCCGCCGFASEIVHFINAMQHYRHIRLTMAPSCFCNGYARAVQDTLERLHLDVERYAANTPKNDIVIWISHTDPLGYKSSVFNERYPDYLIGRSMYEFTRIPNGWTDSSAIANEIWVPGTWVRDTLVADGMDPKKMYIVPEGIDTTFFDPAKRRPFPLPLDDSRPSWRRYCNRQGSPNNFKFFSNFKWEPRKGWDILFSAYAREFSPAEAVSLYVLTFVFEPNIDIYNISFIERQLNHFLSTYLNKSATDLAHFCIISELVTEDELADLYNSADAFVLPTRGEGWGLPTIQAMSLAKPTISTAWGGQMEFMTQDTSFLIDIDGLDEVPRDSIYGWSLGKKWAVPSQKQTAALMRFVEQNVEHAAAVGVRARAHIVEKFGEETVARIADRRLNDIRKWLKHLRANGH